MILVLITLALVFTQLSVLAFGGGNAILPEMQHQVVNIHHWMSAASLAHCLQWHRLHQGQI